MKRKLSKGVLASWLKNQKIESRLFSDENGVKIELYKKEVLIASYSAADWDEMLEVNFIDEIYKFIKSKKASIKTTFSKEEIQFIKEFSETKSKSKFIKNKRIGLINAFCEITTANFAIMCKFGLFLLFSWVMFSILKKLQLPNGVVWTEALLSWFSMFMEFKKKD